MFALKPYYHVALLGAVILGACRSNHSAPSETIAKIPDSVKVPVAEARHLVANYAPHAGKVGKDSLPDTRAIWFDLERLEALVQQIRKEGGDGIRFYLATYDGKYPKDAQGPHVPPAAYWGYNTLIMVSTRDSMANGITYHRDYFSEVDSEGRGLIVRAEAENKGGICPPPDDCHDEGALLLKKH